MLNEEELERVKELEKQIVDLRYEIDFQQIVITGLLAQVINLGREDQSRLIETIRNELEKYPQQSDQREIYMQKYQKIANRFIFSE